MILSRLLLALGLTLALVGTPAHALAAKKAKKAKPVRGVVELITTDKDKDATTITVKVHAKKKKGDTTPAPDVEKKFVLTKETKFETVVGKKKDKKVEPSSLTALEKGSRVMIVAKDDKAETVKILPAKKKKKKSADT